MSFGSILVLSFYLLSIRTFAQTNIEFINKEGLNQWWHAFYINNVNENAGEITNVEILDSSSNGEYVAAYSEEGDLGTFYAFQNSNGWILPFTIRITNCVGDVLIADDIIDNQNSFEVFEFDENFKDSTCSTSSGTDIVLTNKDGVTEWWHAFYISNMNEDGGDITSVEMQDSSSDAVWNTGYSGEADLGTFYAFQASGDSWVLPLSVRITNCVGETLTVTDIVTSRLALSTFDLGSNFEDASACPSEEESDNIIITKYQGYNEWWVAIKIDNVKDGSTINSVELRDSGSDPSGIWNNGVYNDWGDVKVWEFDVNAQERAFVLPFDLKMTDSFGTIIQSDDIITSWDADVPYDFGSNF